MPVNIVKNDWPTLLKRLEENTPKLLDDYAAQLREKAQADMPVATGSARDGLYVISNLRDEYSSAAGKAQSDNPGVTIADKAQLPEGVAALVAGAAGHTIDLELGTTAQPARPTLVPAAEAIRGPLMSALAQVLQP